MTKTGERNVVVFNVVLITFKTHNVATILH